GGEGMWLDVGLAGTPFGECLIAQSPRGICYLAFVEPEDLPLSAFHKLMREWPRARLRRDDAWAEALAATIFSPGESLANATGRGRRKKSSLKVLVRGSEFQVRVWRALLNIPSGALASYGALAGALGVPSAARAVGSAVAKNSIAYLIPCHRVIRETGVIGAYRWGHERKRAILGWEGAQARTLTVRT
ncbi:MAG: methylated-DNA--[protein]-cysteine S-methyltransferase, partial [Burkholderiales bacterium]